MNGQYINREVLTQNIQTLVKERDNFNAADDIYCALMKQMMLNASGLN